MYDVNEYIALIGAIVNQLINANLQQLKRLYAFISEYVKEN